MLQGVSGRFIGFHVSSEVLRRIQEYFRNFPKNSRGFRTFLGWLHGHFWGSQGNSKRFQGHFSIQVLQGRFRSLGEIQGDSGTFKGHSRETQDVLMTFQGFRRGLKLIQGSQRD